MPASCSTTFGIDPVLKAVFPMAANTPSAKARAWID